MSIKKLEIMLPTEEELVEEGLMDDKLEREDDENIKDDPIPKEYINGHDNPSEAERAGQY